MFVTCNRIPVNPERTAAFEARFSERPNRVDEMPGFISFHLLRPQNPGDPYVVMTFWESEAQFKAWTDSPAFKEGHARSGALPPDTFLGRPTLETYQVVDAAAQAE